MLRVKFTLKNVNVLALAKDINQYGEPSGFRLSLCDENGDDVYPDEQGMNQIEEMAIEHLFNKKYSDELSF